MTTEEAIEILESVRKVGPYKLELIAYAKDTHWTLKAHHRDGYNKSCTTVGKTFVEVIEKAHKKMLETPP